MLEANHPEDVRAQLKAAKAKHRLLKRLPKLEANKRLSGFDADTILWTVMEYMDHVAEGKVAPEDLLEEISVPGVPEGVYWEDYEGWTAGTVRAGIEAVAKATDEDPEELLEVATDGARRDIISKEQAAERVKQDLEKITAYSGSPLSGLFLAMTAALLFFLAALAVIGIWVPFTWWRVLAVGGAILSLLLMAGFFAPTKLLPMALDLVVVWAAVTNWLPATPQ